MRRISCLLITGCCLFLSSCDHNRGIELQISSQLSDTRPDAALIIRDRHILKTLTLDNSAMVALQAKATAQTIYGQLDDLNQDGRPELAFFLVDFPNNQPMAFTIGNVAPVTIEPRAQFTLAVKDNGHFNTDGVYIGSDNYSAVSHLDLPEQQEQDSQFVFMEGPLWESDRVGYRYYLDDRNRIDVFGKSQPAMALHRITGDYHTPSAWGADVLKVGKSMGLGSIAMMTDQGPAFIDNAEQKQLTILANGPLRAIMRTTYKGWKVNGKNVNVTSDLEIRGGADWTEHRLQFDGAGDQRMSTGIVKHPAAPELVTGTEAGIFFAYTWGKQSEQNDLLGMAILIPQTFRPKTVSNDPASHLISYSPLGKQAHYRFMAAWQHGTVPVKTQAAFEQAVRQLARRYAYPVSYR